jgi:hypothetical protein
MRRDIYGSIRNALDKGMTLDDAVKSFVNAGYNETEVKEAAKRFGQGAISMTDSNSTPTPQAQVQTQTPAQSPSQPSKIQPPSTPPNSISPLQTDKSLEPSMLKPSTFASTDSTKEQIPLPVQSSASSSTSQPLTQSGGHQALQNTLQQTTQHPQTSQSSQLVHPISQQSQLGQLMSQPFSQSSSQSNQPGQLMQQPFNQSQSLVQAKPQLVQGVQVHAKRQAEGSSRKIILIFLLVILIIGLITTIILRNPIIDFFNSLL